MRFGLFNLFLLTFFAKQCMTSPFPNGNGADKEAYEDVKELESLKSENSKSSNSTEQHNEPLDSEAEESTAQPSASDEVEQKPNSRSAIFRHRGITQAKKRVYWNEKIEQPKVGYTKYAGIQYSPSDLAEYVFSTGDEEGVAVAVEELVREGMMGRTDAINYLQDVKQILAYLKDQYEQQKKIQEFSKTRAYPKPQVSQRLPSRPREQFVSQMATEKREPKKLEQAPPVVVSTDYPHQDAIVSTSEPKGQIQTASTAPPMIDSSVAEALKDDYKRMMKDDENYDFTLEVIYKLAKDMFTESIAKDDPVAEETLSRLVAFMEREVENKKISHSMKQKVLAIISSSLVDSLREYQRMMPENQSKNLDDGNFYRHLFNPNSASSSKMEMPEAYRKLSVGG